MTLNFENPKQLTKFVRINEKCMKKLNLILLLVLSLAIGKLNAAIVVINTVGNTFVPNNVTINFGDTINFQIAGNHDAMEVSQATYNANGTTPLPGGFATPFGGGLVLPSELAVGTHYYVCNPHAAMGMKGIITVLNCNPPSTPSPITGNQTVCLASTNTYQVLPVPGAVSYTWGLPSGWVGTSTTNSITVVVGNVSGTIQVTADNSCGSSPAQTLAITVSTFPNAPDSILGPDSTCANNTYNYSVPIVTGATTYNWTLPTGWTGTSSTNSIIVTPTGNSGTILVNAENTCGASADVSLNVFSTLVDTNLNSTNYFTLIGLDTNAQFIWVDCDSNKIVLSDPTVGFPPYQFYPPYDGNFKAIIIKNGCPDSTSCYSVSRVSTKNIIINNIFKVYPNPFQNQFEIRRVDGQVNYTASIFNLQGKLILTGVNLQNIDLSDSKSGIYILKIESENGIFYEKMVKQ